MIESKASLHVRRTLAAFCCTFGDAREVFLQFDRRVPHLNVRIAPISPFLAAFYRVSNSLLEPLVYNALNSGCTFGRLRSGWLRIRQRLIPWLHFR